MALRPAGFSLADDSRFVPTVIVTTSDLLLRKIEQLTLTTSACRQQPLSATTSFAHKEVWLREMG